MKIISYLSGDVSNVKLSDIDRLQRNIDKKIETLEARVDKYKEIVKNDYSVVTFNGPTYFVKKVEKSDIQKEVQDLRNIIDKLKQENMIESEYSKDLVMAIRRFYSLLEIVKDKGIRYIRKKELINLFKNLEDNLKRSRIL